MSFFSFALRNTSTLNCPGDQATLTAFPSTCRQEFPEPSPAAWLYVSTCIFGGIFGNDVPFCYALTCLRFIEGERDMCAGVGPGFHIRVWDTETLGYEYDGT